MSCRSYESAIAASCRLKECHIYRHSPLPLGMCNLNYRLETDDGCYLLRLFGQQPLTATIDRRQEFDHQYLAYTQGIAAEPLELDPQLSWMLCRFAPGAPLMQPGQLSPAQLRTAGQTLATLHRQPMEGTTADLWQCAQHYWQALNTGVDEPTQTMWRQLAPFLQCLATALDSHCLCHNDLNRGNLLFDVQHRGTALMLIDWEYAGANDPHMDLASLICEFELTNGQQQLLLTSYNNAANRVISTSLLDRARVGYLALCWLWETLQRRDVGATGQAQGRYYHQLRDVMASRQLAVDLR